jgi:putative membrane protein
MSLAADIMIGIIGLFHIWILVLEMFLWTKPTGRKTFMTSKEEAETSKVLAANQGLYNGFLAAGLLISLIQTESVGGSFKVFFLSCVAIAGIYGGLTANKRIILVQTVPAAIALGLIAFS